MGSDKAPGPDGFNPAFYQDFWDIVGPSVTRDCQEWLQRNQVPPTVCQTNIILLPKVEKPERMQDLRPISLCNVRYRILAKVLANRLRRFMPDLIKEEQSAFVQGRSIIDNAMIAFESIHSMTTKSPTKVGSVALKVDISKAYDRVEWPYLETIMRKMGFSETWIRWMMLFVRSVRYEVVVNNNRFGQIQPRRGLRQGCPLSPFLFILCTEGLTAMLRKASLNGTIHGFRVCRQAPPISHLLFADDSVFFFKGNVQEARAIKSILTDYAAASGQLVNYDKSGLLFSKKTDAAVKTAISRVLAVWTPFDTERYLGVPALVGRNRNHAFKFIQEKVWNRLQSWHSRKLSNGGKEVLIKAVIQALPAYSMNVFLLPDRLITELERMMNAFWWGSKKYTGRGISWRKWKKLTVQKEHGGLGFRDLRGFNLAMLGKQAWRLLSKPDSLVARLYKAKYFPTRDILMAELGPKPSFAWRSLWSSLELVRKGYRWRIGNGLHTRIGLDPWLPNNDNRYISAPIPQHLIDMNVHDLLDHRCHDWNIPLLEQLLPSRDVQLITSIPITTAAGPDKRIWHGSKNGRYTVKSAYRLYMDTMVDHTVFHQPGVWSNIWELHVPASMKHFLWRLVSDVLPTRGRLRRKKLAITGECGFCGHDYEETWHLFTDCQRTTEVWQQLEILPIVLDEANNHSDLPTLFWNLHERLSPDLRDKWLIGLWGIWRERNARVWTKLHRPIQMVVEESMQAMSDWRKWNENDDTDSIQQRRHYCLQWHPPPENTLKCYVDMARSVTNISTGFGMCLRNHNGDLLHYRASSKLGLFEIRIGEAYALLEALRWVADMGLRNVEYEGDSQVLALALKSQEEDDSEFGRIVDSCRKLLLCMGDVSYSFVRRVRNTVADAIAKQSLFHVGCFVGTTPPIWLSDVLGSCCRSLDH
ncbi:LINE-1 reverse transcriptase homolog [Linum grandiflorum]